MEASREKGRPQRKGHEGNQTAWQRDHGQNKGKVVRVWHTGNSIINIDKKRYSFPRVATIIPILKWWLRRLWHLAIKKAAQQ